MYLLDVSVLVALLEPMHEFHNEAHRWFAARGDSLWATCPITENGVLRILSGPPYRNSPGSIGNVAVYLADLRTLPGHVFLADDISLIDEAGIVLGKLRGPSQITDVYLLAFARKHEGKFVTFDRRVATDAVQEGMKSLVILGA